MADAYAYAWLVVGIVLIVVGAVLLAEFVFQFAKLIIGLILLFAGVMVIGVARQPRARVKRR